MRGLNHDNRFRYSETLRKKSPERVEFSYASELKTDRGPTLAKSSVDSILQKAVRQEEAPRMSGYDPRDFRNYHKPPRPKWKQPLMITTGIVLLVFANVATGGTVSFAFPLFLGTIGLVAILTSGW